MTCRVPCQKFNCATVHRFRSPLQIWIVTPDTMNDEWSKIEYQTGAQYACTVFDQLVFLIRASLIFNASLAVGGIYIMLQKLLYLGNFPLALFILGIIALIFNLTTVVSHNALWEFIRIVLERQTEIERNNAELFLYSHLNEYYDRRNKSFVRNAQKLSIVFSCIVVVIWWALIGAVWCGVVP